VKAVLRREGFGESFDGAPPTEIVRETPGCGAQERSREPSTKAARLRIHILDVEAVIDVFTRLAMIGMSKEQRAFGTCEHRVAERGFQMHADTSCRLSQRQPVDDGAGIIQPFLALAQMCQGRTGGRVEPTVARLAHIALHAGGNAPLGKSFCAAAPASRCLGKLGFQ